MSLKIGLVTGEYPPMEGGVGAFTKELAVAMHELGHEIHIITSTQARPQQSQPASRSLGELYQQAEKRGEPIDLKYAKLHPRGYRWRWGDMRMVADIALRYELDVVNIQYQAAAYNMWSSAINFLPWRLRGLTKSVVTYHDLRVPYLFPKASSLRKRVVFMMGRHADGVIVTNQTDGEELRPNLKADICQIPIGSNIRSYDPNHIELQDVRDSMGLEKEDKLLGYFGFLNNTKGADDLVKALAELDDHYHLVFVGGRTGASDSMNNRAFFNNLDGLIHGLGLEDRVHWTGFLTDIRVSTYLHAIDLMVMPYKDGASLRRGTLMAAFSHGRPLITTEPDSPIPELEHAKNVWYVPRDEPTKLYEAIAKLMQEAPLREQLGQEARKVADLFTWDKIAQDTIRFFQSIIHSSSRG